MPVNAATFTACGCRGFVTVESLPIKFCALPGSLSDVQGLAELPLCLAAVAEVAADAAYTFYEWEDSLRESERGACSLHGKRTRSGGTRPTRMITSNGCAAASRRSSARSRNCSGRRYMRLRCQAFC